MKELIAQLEAKIAELKALQAQDPNIETAFSKPELDQLQALYSFAQKRIDALKAHQAKQAAKQTTTPKEESKPITTTPKEESKPTTKPEDKPKSETPTEDEELEKFLSSEEKEDEEEDKFSIGSPDFKAIGETLEKNKDNLATTEKAEKLIAEKLDEKLKDPDLSKVERDALTKAKDLNEMADLSVSEETIEKLKNLPKVDINIGENGGDVKISKGDNSVEAGIEFNEDGSLKSGKVEVETKDLVLGVDINENGGTGKIGGKATNTNGDEITAVVNVGIDLEKKEATIGGSYSVEKSDGSKTETEANLTVGKDHLAVKGSHMTEDADGHKKGLEGELDISKDKVKVGFGVGTENEEKETKTEVSGSLEITKNKAVAELQGKHSFKILPKKEARIPLASAGVATLYAVFGVEVGAEVEVKTGAQLQYDDSKGLDFMAKIIATAKASLTGTAGLALTILELVEGRVELAVTAAIQATAELAFQINKTKDRLLAALHDVKGSISSKIILTVGAAPGVKAIYESLGGDGSSLEYSYEMGHMELLTFTAPSYHNGKGWDTSSWGFGKGKDIIALENKVQWVGDFVNAIVGTLKAIAEFIGNVLSAIGDFLVSIGKALIEWGVKAIEGLAAIFSPAYRKEQEAKALRDTKFKSIVESAVKAVKKTPKHIERLSKTDPKFREAELQKIVMEDQMVKDAWVAIYQTKDMQEADALKQQLDADIKEFRLVARSSKYTVGADAQFDFILNSTSAFPVNNMRIDVKCNGKTVKSHIIKGLVEVGATKRTYTFKLPYETELKGIDLTKATWSAAAVLDLVGDLKDRFSPAIPIIVAKPPTPIAPPVDLKSTNKGNPIGSLVLLGAQSFTLSDTTAPAIKARLTIDISPDSYISDKLLAWVPISLNIKCGDQLISSVSLDRPLRRGIVNVFESSNLFLPKKGTFADKVQESIGWFDYAMNGNAAITNAIRNTPVTLNMTAFGVTLYTQKLNIQIA